MNNYQTGSPYGYDILQQNYQTLNSIRQLSVAAAVLWWIIPLWWVALILQIVIAVKSSQLQQMPNKITYIVCSVIGIFFIGLILSIVIAVESKRDLELTSQGFSPIGTIQ